MTQLPSPVKEGVEGALTRLGRPAGIVSATPISGGCINHGARLDAGDGRSYFLKWNASAPARMFEAEANGLQALADACPLRVPRSVARGGGAGIPAWLLMEYVVPGHPADGYDVALGRGLAALHAGSGHPGSGHPAPGRETFGWQMDNWIGALNQANPSTDSWTGFWRDHRLVPQLDQARRAGHLSGSAGQTLDRLINLIPTALADVEGSPPALLHGDLWSGNAYPDESGAPVLIDPAVYAGHGEVDLAMTGLFGGFSSSFYAAYDEVVPITDAYDAYRRDLYQLYYLLVHVNLFGSGYVNQTLSAAFRVVSALE